MPDFDSTERELHQHLGEPVAGGHPPLRLLLAFGQEVLPPEIESGLQTHLQQCRSCSMLLRDLETLPETPLSPAQNERLVASLPTGRDGTIATPRFRPFPVLTAIAALLLLTAGFFHFHKSAAPVASKTPPPVIEASPAPVAVAQLEIPLSPLAPPADGSVALQTRGQGSDEPSVELLMPAFIAYNKGNYAVAELQFNPLLKTYPRSEIVPLYVGVSRLYLGKDQQAYNALTMAQHNASSIALPAAQWYTAIAAQRMHRPEAQSLLKSICEAATSKYAAESCLIAPTLSR